MNNKKIKPIIISFIISIFVFGFFPSTVLAENADLQMKVQPSTIKQGETFTIKVTFTSDSEGIGSLDASLSYDGNLMEYNSQGSNTVQLSKGKGMIIDSGSTSSKTMSYSFQFIARKAGKATFSVNQSELIGYDTGKLLGNPKGSIDLTIQASPNQGNQEEPEEPDDDEETPDPEEDPIEVNRDGKLIYIFRDYPNSELPEGFEPHALTFMGQEVLGAKNPSNDMILLYGIDQNLQYAFYIYDYTENLVPYVTLTVSGDQEYTFLPMDITPEGYQPDEIVINGNAVSVSKPENFKGIYLVKAMNRDGETGYYFYDESEGTIQRVKIHNNVVELEKEGPSFHWVIILLAGIAIILLIMVILFYSSYKRRKKKKS